MAKKSLNIPARSSLWYLASGISSKAIGILSTPIFTRMLSAEEYGSFAFYMSVLGILSGIMLPIASGSQIYSIIEKFKVDKKHLLLSMSVLILTFSSIICMLLFAFSSILKLDFRIILLLSLQVLFDSVVLIYMSLKKYEYGYKTVSFISIFEAFASPLISVFLINRFEFGYLGRIVGLLAVSTTSAVFILFSSISSTKRAQKVIVKAHFQKSIPLIPSAAVGALGSHADRLLIAYMLGGTAIGMYSVAHTLGVGIYFLITALSSSLTPWIVRRLCAEENKRISEVISTVGSGISSASLFLIALSPEALSLLAPSEYLAALPAVMPIALSVIFAFFSTVLSTVIIHNGKGAFLFFSKLISLFVSLIFGVILIPMLGFFGAGTSVLLSEGALLFTDFLYLKRIGAKEVLSFNNMAKEFLLTLSVAVLMFIFRDSLSIRILLLIIPSVRLISTLSGGRGLLLEKI